MKIGQSSNPALTEKIYDRVGTASTVTDQAMTIRGAVNKTGIMLLIVIISSYFTWQKALTGANVMPWIWAGIIGGLIAAIVTVVKKEWAPVTAPIYAALEGLFLGAISATFNALYGGIVLKAVFITFSILFIMLFAYRTGLIKATPKFKRGVMIATGGVALFYLASWLMGMFGVEIGFLHQGGPLAIIISIVIIVIASMNLVLDFDFIEQAAQQRLPKYMEWYSAFGLMVTLIWLYLEILRLLAMLSGDD